MNHWTADKANIPASVHARLLGIAKEEGVPLNTVAIRFVSERLLYRVSRSEYADRFVLKGAWLFYLWGLQRRTTRDVDFLGHGDNSTEDLEKAFREITQLEVSPDDGVRFDPESIDVSRLHETEDYPGVRIRVTALIGTGRYKAQVDIGFGEALVEDPVEEELPVLLDFPRPRIRVYSPEASIAEKVEAMVRFGARNSRMKDYFDLFTLSRERRFDGSKLQNQISATFFRRETKVPSDVPTGLQEGFARDRQEDWERFVADSGASATPSDFGEVIEAVRDFIFPPLRAASDGESFTLQWEPGQSWLDPAD